MPGFPTGPGDPVQQLLHVCGSGIITCAATSQINNDIMMNMIGHSKDTRFIVILWNWQRKKDEIVAEKGAICSRIKEVLCFESENTIIQGVPKVTPPL